MEIKFRPIGLQDFLVVILFVSLLVFRLDMFASDPGLGWHIATGQFITENFSVPKQDNFLFSTDQQSWVADQWLADLLIYNLLRFGDWSFLYNVFTIFFAFIFLIYIYSKTIKLYDNYLLSSLTILYTFLCASIHFLCRPVMISFLFFAITFFNMFLWKKSHYQENSTKTSIALALTFLLWANIHPSFIIGLFLIFVFVLGDFLKHRFLNKRLAFLFLALIFVTFISPYGAGLHESIVFLSQSKFAMQHYIEWQEVELNTLIGSVVLIPIVLLVILILTRKFYQSKINLIEITFFLVFLYLTLNSVRMLPYYGIVSIPIIVKSTSAILALFNLKYKIFSLLNKSFSRLESKEKRSYQGFPLFIIITIILLLNELITNQVFLFKGDYGPSRAHFPYQALDLLNQESSKQIYVLNDINFGGFVTWYGGSKVKAYIDDRTSLHRDEFYFNYMDMMTPQNILPFAKSVNADYILLDNGKLNKELTLYLKEKQKDWIIYADDHSLLAKVVK